MNLEDGKITQEMDVIAYADIYTAFSENRPYRDGLKADEISNHCRTKSTLSFFVAITKHA